MSEKSIFRITFLQQGQVYEVFARQVSPGGLLGFIEIEELLFGERSQVVVDPSEERLKSEFEGVRRFYVPMHAVVRIDEVEKQGVPRIRQPADGQENVSPFPVPMYTPGDKGEKS
jgi:hypothetical protein